MSLVSLLRPNGPNGFGYGTTALEVTSGLDLSGKTYLVTGANSGIGLESMRVLRLRGARVFGTGRTLDRVKQFCSDVGATPLACDLAEPRSVMACVEQLQTAGVTLDGLLCNAGIMALPKLQQVHGYEAQFFTNHMGHFMLVTRLLPQLASDARVVVVSSNAHRKAPPEGIAFDNLAGTGGYVPWIAYGQSKLCNLLFVRALARRFAGTERSAFAVHPGVIQTNITRSSGFTVQLGFAIASPLLLKSISQGAATQLYVLTHPGAKSGSGGYFSHCNPAPCYAHGDDAAMAERLWQLSEGIAASVSTPK